MSYSILERVNAEGEGGGGGEKGGGKEKKGRGGKKEARLSKGSVGVS